MRRIIVHQAGLALGAALLIAGCARPVPPPVLTASPLHGAYTRGTIIAVRDTGDAAGTAGLSGALAALGAAAPATAPPTQELVIRRADRSIVSLVQATPPGEAPFRAGQTVAIITAAQTIVRRE